MKSPIAILKLILVVLLTALAVQTSLAQPSGSITNLVLNQTNAVWDLGKLLQSVDFTVTRVTNQKTNTEAEFSYSDPYSVGGGGKLSGGPAWTSVSANLINSTIPTSYHGIYRVSGSVTSSKTLATLILRTKVTGEDFFQGQYRILSGSATYTIKVDNLARQLSARLASSAMTGGGGVSSSAFLGSFPVSQLGAMGDGTWTLVLRFGETIGNTLGGNATVTLNSGTVYFYAFTGTYTPRTGVSKVNLLGYDTQAAPGAGSVLQVTLDSSNKITRITGRIAGQTVKVTP